MADIATLQAWLTEAETAHHKLVTGSATASVKYEGRYEVTYAKADLDKLDAYIAALRSQLSANDGTPQTRRRPIQFTF